VARWAAAKSNLAFCLASLEAKVDIPFAAIIAIPDVL
jgi:hypothetical protein